MADRSSYTDEKETKDSVSDGKVETGGEEHDIAFARRTM